MIRMNQISKRNNLTAANAASFNDFTLRGTSAIMENMLKSIIQTGFFNVSFKIKIMTPAANVVNNEKYNIYTRLEYMGTGESINNGNWIPVINAETENLSVNIRNSCESPVPLITAINPVNMASRA